MQHCQETVFVCGLLDYVNTYDATQLRACNHHARAAVEAYPWADMKTRIYRVRPWRACFPRATKANLSHNSKLAHHEFVHLENVTSLNLSYCESYSFINKSFQHLRALRHLDLSHGWQDTRAWAFFREAFDDDLFRYLGNLETLNLDGYRVNQFNGEFSQYLPRLRALQIRDWVKGPRNIRAFFKNMNAEVYVTDECLWVLQNWHEMPRRGFHITACI